MSSIGPNDLFLCVCVCIYVNIWDSTDLYRELLYSIVGVCGASVCLFCCHRVYPRPSVVIGAL